MPAGTRKKSPSRAANTRGTKAEVNIRIIPQATQESNRDYHLARIVEYHLARIVEMLGNIKSERTMTHIYWFVQRVMLRE